MDSFFLKINILLVGALSLVFSTQGQDKLSQADSLFSSQKYTEAFAIYQEILKEGQASPAMLGKMAYIKEGLGNYAEALYLLHQYYELTSDRRALTKMKEIAQAHELQGYEYTDLDFFLNFIHRYHQQLMLATAALVLLTLAYVFRKKSKKETPAVSLMMHALLLMIFAVLVNGWLFPSTAIVREEQTIAMSGPSAGAEPVTFLAKGHKVKLLKQDELWSEILWEDQRVFVRSKNLYPL